ncbi:MAG: tetratricopeptide repeat protein, partial [Bacteroidales bacterium]|nr:tetratricopeptide repeat protein [Bacteroidales bacterium]
KAGLANNYNNLGTLYYKIANYKKALDYFKKALVIYEEKQPDGNTFGSVVDISRPVGNISVIYKELEKFDSALIFAEKALELNKKAGNDYGVAGTMNNIGYIYDGMQKYSLAIQAYKQSLEINKRVNDKWSIANTNTNIANSFIASGNYDAAETYLDQALLIANGINAKDVLIFINESFSKLYKNKGLYKNSLEYYTRMTELKDSVLTEEKYKQITEMQVKYESEKKEKENIALKKDNEIKQLRLSNKNTVINAMITGIIISLILLVIILYLLRKRTIAYKNLVTKNLELARCDRKILAEGEFIPELEIITIKEESNDQGSLKKDLELIREFNKYLAEEKPYLYTNINIEDVSAQLGTNRTYLSKAINTVFKKSFNILINEFRVRAARQLLTDSKYAHLSIEGIGEMVGYNSRIVFYKNFKKVTGLTPSYFRESILRKP